MESLGRLLGLCTRSGIIRTILVAAIIILLLGNLMVNYRKSKRSRGIKTESTKSEAKTSESLSLPLGEVAAKVKELKNSNLLGTAHAEGDLVKHTGQESPWRLESRPVSSVLLEGLIPTNVHLMWCGKGWFEFREYLTVMSILRVLAPDKIVFHYELPPTIDDVFYHQWLDDLKHDYPFLVLEQMNKGLVEFCNGSTAKQIEVLSRLLNVDGGIYVSSNTWLLDIPPESRLVDVENALEMDSVDGYLMVRRGVLKNTTLRDVLHDSPKTRSRQCAHIHHVYTGELRDGCVIVKGGIHNRFYPMDIWELDNPFGRLCRRIFYGTEEIRAPKPTFDELVPNIGHMVWIGGGRMDYVFFLSVLSMLFVVKVDVVYIHGNLPPKGPNWERLQSIERIRSRVVFVTRSPPDKIYQGKIEPWYVALMSDLIRVDLMIKYGGVYTDTDAIWVRGLSHEDRGYDAVASFDWVDWSWPFPDSVNFGLSYGKKNAPFWRVFRESMRVLHNDNHGFTGVMMPYKLLEKHPDLLRIDRHLQVICYKYKCHPIWVKDYHNMSRDHTTDGSLDNWREVVNAFHWTHPNPQEYANETTLRHATGIFADVGRFVLEAAGLW